VEVKVLVAKVDTAAVEILAVLVLVLAEIVATVGAELVEVTHLLLTILTARKMTRLLRLAVLLLVPARLTQILLTPRRILLRINRLVLSPLPQ
jgi:hypothetical protein